MPQILGNFTLASSVTYKEILLIDMGKQMPWILKWEPQEIKSKYLFVHFMGYTVLLPFVLTWYSCGISSNGNSKIVGIEIHNSINQASLRCIFNTCDFGLNIFSVIRTCVALNILKQRKSHTNATFYSQVSIKSFTNNLCICISLYRFVFFIITAIITELREHNGTTL